MNDFDITFNGGLSNKQNQTGTTGYVDLWNWRF